MSFKNGTLANVTEIMTRLGGIIKFENRERIRYERTVWNLNKNILKKCFWCFSRFEGGGDGFGKKRCKIEWSDVTGTAWKIPCLNPGGNDHFSTFSPTFSPVPPKSWHSQSLWTEFLKSARKEFSLHKVLYWHLNPKQAGLFRIWYVQRRRIMKKKVQKKLTWLRNNLLFGRSIKP